MTCHTKSNIKISSTEPVLSKHVEKRKKEQLQMSPLKESVVFKAPLPTVFSLNDDTRAIHNKENSSSGAGHEAQEDSGYLSLNNSHNEENFQVHGAPTSAVRNREIPETPKPSPQKSRESLSPLAGGLFTPLDFDRTRHASLSSTPAQRPPRDSCLKSRDSQWSTPAQRPPRDSCLPIVRFNQAVCEELSRGFRKNKRYDWSVVPKLAEHFHLDRVVGAQMGLDHVDLFSSLLCRNLKNILAQILALLEDLDLISCKKVSKTWRRIILEDKAALKRSLNAEKRRRESNVFDGTPRLTRDEALSRVILSSVQRLGANSSKPGTPALLKTTTPKCSRFNQFLEAAGSLRNHESLCPCSRCGSPAVHLKEAQRATCTRLECGFEFCSMCRLRFHGSTPCRELRPRPHLGSSHTPTILPGSARSKRNIRRL